MFGACGKGLPGQGGVLLAPVAPRSSVFLMGGTCQPREVLVNVHKEPPQGSGHFFKPSCVALQRCAGCCSDEAVQCSAGQKRTVSLQIMLVSSSTQTSQLEKEDFTEHVTCECRPQNVNKAKSGKRSQGKGQPRARLPFV
ncbi:snake venom vascular endothelial growth factor toxin HF-like [Pseudonaja textilis]|uniref:snake venom vascular endothelial growth factor toxin HF-like n=1 Tax=Pseudonaja textilis TaxID=8673 RepID=UPI000EA84DAF|nr:snake venom vascular endothelial growth factor toxin HF-like [Pseudonaja textilis]